MAHRDKVTRSIETPDGTRCADLFRRPDGSYGFAEYRRDPEDPRGWQPTAYHGDARFLSEADALAEARRMISWLDAVLD